MKLLQIDSCLGVGSTGRITESIASLAKSRGWDCCIIHGARYVRRPSCMKEIQTTSVLGEYFHYTEGLLLDNHGLSSRFATKRAIKAIQQYQPDVIQLHCIHGYYMNYKILFEYLRSTKVPVVWTFHDCWAFTGHCAYFDSINCKKWKTNCHNCELKKSYPTSLLLDKSIRNYKLKQRLFTSINDRLVIVPVSYWLEDLVRHSFFKEARIQTIHNGVDLDVFAPQNSDRLRNSLGLGEKKVILGVALPWSPRKGLNDMIKISKILPKDIFQIMLIGLDDKQIANLPEGVIGIKRTNNVQELAEYYSLASVFVNPTYEDNFPTTNIEALSCGTPVITYKTGGSPEAISNGTGWVVNQGDVEEIATIINTHFGRISRHEIEALRKSCRERAQLFFDKKNKFIEYVELYDELITKKS